MLHQNMILRYDHCEGPDPSPESCFNLWSGVAPCLWCRPAVWIPWDPLAGRWRLNTPAGEEKTFLHPVPLTPAFQWGALSHTPVCTAEDLNAEDRACSFALCSVEFPGKEKRPGFFTASPHLSIHLSEQTFTLPVLSILHQAFTMLPYPSTTAYCPTQ